MKLNMYSVWQNYVYSIIIIIIIIIINIIIILLAISFGLVASSGIIII